MFHQIQSLSLDKFTDNFTDMNSSNNWSFEETVRLHESQIEYEVQKMFQSIQEIALTQDFSFMTSLFDYIRYR